MRLLALLAAQSVVCEAVRRPGLARWNLLESYSKSVSMAPGADGQLHSLTRETQTSRVGEGPSARMESVVRECRDGECKERRSSGPPPSDHRLALPSPFFYDFPHMLAAPIFDMGFGNMGFGNMGFGELGFHGLNEVRPGRPLGEWQPLDSVTRTVEITEENGERKRREYVTRCRDGKCTTEEVHADGTATMLEAKGPAALEQGTPHDAGAVERKPSTGGPHADATEAAPSQRPGEAAASASDGAQGPGVAAGALGERREGVPAPSEHRLARDLLPSPLSRAMHSMLASPSIFDMGFGDMGFGGLDRLWSMTPSAEWRPVDGITRTIEITEKDGERRRREYVTRCRDGKCTTEEVHADGTASVLEAGRRSVVEQGPSPDANAAAGARAAQAEAADATEPASSQRPVAEDASASEGPSVATASPRRSGGSVGRAVEASRKEAGDAAKVGEARATDAAQPRSSAEASAGPRSAESVTRTIVIKEVDGRRETTEIVERCRDGKCTREVRRSDGEDVGGAIEG